MAKLPQVVRLDAEEEARRLWQASLDSRSRAEGSLVALWEALDLGVRAAEILAVQRLQVVRQELPATIASQLRLPSPEIDLEEDAAVNPRVLQFTDAIDMLSEFSLPCASPRLHRGWEDRRFACRRARETARRAVGHVLGSAARERLLLLSAYRNRIFRSPPPVRVVPREILDGIEELERLVAGLLRRGPADPPGAATPSSGTSR